MNPGNVGVSKSRAMVCELLAVRLMKEFSTRELIDVLFYDFDPLQGLAASGTANVTPSVSRLRSHARGARISAVEVAIRAQAKRFLAHPLVVQQLEAVWAGNIVFHSAADNMHRQPPKERHALGRSYGTIDSSGRVPNEDNLHGRDRSASRSLASMTRRSVTLYDPRDASLFKLSRLRVPRYRQIFSTCSFAVMLALFVAVLAEKSRDITPLEVIFWFWSLGYMLDEVVGFTEQGFGLYIMSVWNAFDLGILLLFMVYYVLRLYGILMPDISKRHTANMAYDVLASTAVLLFPRLFSVLDHYRYFSQLLIAFRMMAVDLFAILILITISCSGFFVAFTLSFSDEEFNAASAAYSCFQIVMGFTPAAWQVWEDYNLLGKAILILFLIICHFLIVTILITVLTNSFLAISQNANEEHQFLFAVNTISMVKSDALFSYIPPTNIIGWLLAPSRYFIPFRRFVKLNRTIIKATHFPVLFVIFGYERAILSHQAYDPTDLVEQRGRSSGRRPTFSLLGPADLFSPGTRLREPSVATFRKDKALEEVFRRPYRDSSALRPHKESLGERAQSSNMVRDWMQDMGHEGGPASPVELARSIVDRLEIGRSKLRRAHTSQHRLHRKRNASATSKSVLSEREESRPSLSRLPHPIREEDSHHSTSVEGLPQQTDADGDDELVTNDEDEQGTSDRTTSDTDQDDSDKENRPHKDSSEGDDFFQTPLTTKLRTTEFPDAVSPKRAPLADAINNLSSFDRAMQQQTHARARNVSTNTIIYSPLLPPQHHGQPTPSPRSLSPLKHPLGARKSGTATATGSGTATPGRRTPKRPGPGAGARPRPIMPPRDLNSAPNLAGLLALDRRKPSLNTMALDLASDLGDNRHRPDAHLVGAMPASFSTQMAMATHMRRRKWRGEDHREDGENKEDAGMMSRIMLARMQTLEEGFREMLREVKGLTREGGSVGSVEVRGKKERKERRKNKSKAPLAGANQVEDAESFVERSSV